LEEEKKGEGDVVSSRRRLVIYRKLYFSPGRTSRRGKELMEEITRLNGFTDFDMYAYASVAYTRFLINF